MLLWKNVAFRSCISNINSTSVDHADIVMPMYDLLEYSHNYSNTSGSLPIFIETFKSIMLMLTVMPQTLYHLNIRPK